MAQTVSAKSCEYCKEEFDSEARCPRLLQCAHTLCHYCVDLLIKKDIKTCPFCITDFTAKIAYDVPINETHLEYIQSLGKGQVSQKRVRIDGRSLPRTSIHQDESWVIVKKPRSLSPEVSVDTMRFRPILKEHERCYITSMSNRHRISSIVTPRPLSVGIQKEVSELRRVESPLEEINRAKKLVREHRIFAMQERLGDRVYAKLSYENDNDKDLVYLHQLGDETVPPDAYFLKHKNLLARTDPSNKKVFLELASNTTGRTLGKLIIRLTSTSPRAQNFQLLCTGEKGFSYANTKILGVGHRGKNNEFVYFGDYEKNSGKGGKTLTSIDESTNYGLNIKLPWKTGTVTGWADGFGGAAIDSQFKIYTKDRLGHIFEPPIGMVDAGLSILTDIVDREEDIRNVIISSCGIILPETIESDDIEDDD